MKRHLTLSIGLGALLIAHAAIAQEVQIGYQGLPYKTSQNESNNGIQVSDGVLMHVGGGAEAGYDSNVFYQQTGIGSGIIRVNGFAEVTNATRNGAVPSGLSFDARAGLQYRRYTSDNSALDSFHNAFIPTAGFQLGTSASPTLSFGFGDSFMRMEDPPYNPTQSLIIRDNNQASAEMRWAPGGGRINVLLRYSNMIDIFETNQYSYADTLNQSLLLDASWKWLPKTALFLQASQGYISYLNSTPATPMAGAPPPKYSSYPLHIAVGLRGLVTDKIAALAAVGYANAFYSCATGFACVSTSGILGSGYANLEGTYHPSLLARVVAGWRHDFQNSVISTFYYDDQFYGSFVQQLGSRMALDLSGRYDRRNYQGYLDPNSLMPKTRVDHFFQVGATLDYFIRNYAYAGLGYALVANESAYTLPPSPSQMAMGITTGGSVNYAKNQFFARAGITY
jgi:hypothetical protein